ncbi:MAG: aminotransferase class V-fold PLP-dependent enzyme [Methanomicrobiales archaeon]|nr:aminotransferase class V-fold PLP-dependent enzyme [Methanomicrobiales archaeon]
MAEHLAEPLIYLNNAATSWPKPQEVLDEVTRCLQAPFFEHGRSTAGGVTDYPSATREALVHFFNAEHPDHFIFTQNATDSLNILIHGFVKKQGAPFHAITTELEHNSVLRPLNALAQEGRLSLSTVPFDDNFQVPLRELKTAIRPDTRLIVMNHGSNVLGSLQNIRPVAEYCADHNIFLIVDGAQTAGQVPINLSEIPAGAFVFTGHKALFGMPGIGGFYLADPEAILPVRQGGTGTDSRSLSPPDEMPQRFEPGTHNYPGMASLLAGIRFIEREGMDAISTKGRDLTALFLRGIGKDPNIILHNPSPDLPVISFNIRNLDNDEAGYILAKAYNIITRTGLHCAPLVHERIDGGKGSVRVSLSCLTTPEECRQAAEAVREVANGANP